MYRPLKFVKYLREYGWEPVVLTINAVCAHSKDNGLLDDIPENVVIERVPQLDFYRLVNIFKRKSAGIRAGCDNKVGEGLENDRAIHTESLIRRTLSGIKRNLPVFVRNVFFIPDDEVPWLPVAFVRAVRLAKREGVEAVMTTSPPQSAHLVGLLTKWATGLPWLVDFRDLWVDTFDFYPKKYGQWRKPVERWMERVVIKHADSVINISQGESRYLQSEYKTVNSLKFHVIHNGYDPEDFSEKAVDYLSESKQEDKKLRIVYVGTLYPTTADEFFQVLTDCFESNPGLESDIELLFIGNVDPGYEKIITSSNFRNSVRILGQKPHAEAINAMCNADVLLVLQGGDKMKDTEVPGKIFEYMGSGRHILALVKPGDVSAILSKTNTALIVNPEDTDVIKKQLLDLIELKKQRRLIPYPNNEYIHTFSRNVLTGKLGVLLDKTISRSS